MFEEVTVINPAFLSRQFYKRQRAQQEYQKMIAKYDTHCGEVLCRQATDEEKARYDKIIRDRPKRISDYEVKHAYENYRG